jgi:hypothetical protein
MVEEKIAAVCLEDRKEIPVVFIQASTVPVLGIKTELYNDVLQTGRDGMYVIIRDGGDLGALIDLSCQTSPEDPE